MILFRGARVLHAVLFDNVYLNVNDEEAAGKFLEERFNGTFYTFYYSFPAALLR